MLWLGLGMLAIGLSAAWYFRPRQVKRTLKNTTVRELGVLSRGETERFLQSGSAEGFPQLSMYKPLGNGRTCLFFVATAIGGLILVVTSMTR